MAVISGVDAMSIEQLDEEIGELAAHINAATCRWLLLVAEFDRREGWFPQGAKTCAEWLSWRCGVSPRAARDQVRVAKRLTELTYTREAFARGELSYSKVRAITRVAEAATEAELVGLARFTTAAQLDRLVRGYRGVLKTQLQTVEQAERYVDCWWEDDGSLSVRARLTPEDGALFLKALEAGRDHVQACGSAEPLPEEGLAPGPATSADALVLMADTMLADEAVGRTGGDRCQFVVHVDAETLSDDAADGRCELEHGPALPAETARRLACDASLVTLVERDGHPLHLGRKKRTIQPALRRALRHRDGGCCFPGCQEHRFVDAHHITHWAHGGKTDLDNLMLLCRRHHRLVHEGGFAVERRRGARVTFTRPDGRTIPAVPRNRGGDHRTLRERNAGCGITASTTTAQASWGRFDADMTVTALLGLRQGAPPVVQEE